MTLSLKAIALKQGAFALTADLSLPKGSLCALIGPSGCGKSTLLSAIAGFLPADAGSIYIDSVDITDRAPGAPDHAAGHSTTVTPGYPRCFTPANRPSR